MKRSAPHDASGGVEDGQLLRAIVRGIRVRQIHRLAVPTNDLKAHSPLAFGSQDVAPTIHSVPYCYLFDALIRLFVPTVRVMSDAMHVPNAALGQRATIRSPQITKS